MGLIPGLPESDTAIGNTFLMAGYGYILLQVRLCPSCTPLCLAALPSVGRVATRGADCHPRLPAREGMTPDVAHGWYGAVWLHPSRFGGVPLARRHRH